MYDLAILENNDELKLYLISIIWGFIYKNKLFFNNMLLKN